MSANKATIAELLDRWLDTADHEFITRDGYQRYIAAKILPALGGVQVRKLTVETLDQFYAELRKRGGVGGRPLAGSTVRKVHFILRAALGLAVKWGWIPDNPAELATVPRFVRQDVDPPTPEDVTRFLEAAWARDPDLGVLLWLAMVTGARRGELCGLRWSHVHLDDGYVLIARSLAHRGRERREKDTKTHQSRRVALDKVTAEILAEHRARCEARAGVCEATLRPDGYVFSTTVDGAAPTLPDSLTQRIQRLSARLGVHVTLRGLRHYAATQMLTRGVDLRTAAGRLGHGDGGTTTLPSTPTFLPAPDQRAAEILAGTVQRPTTARPDLTPGTLLDTARLGLPALLHGLARLFNPTRSTPTPGRRRRHRAWASTHRAGLAARALSRVSRHATATTTTAAAMAASCTLATWAATDWTTHPATASPDATRSIGDTVTAPTSCAPPYTTLKLPGILDILNARLTQVRTGDLGHLQK